MKNQIINFLNNINPVYICLSSLLFLALLIFLLQRKSSKFKIEITIIIYVIISWIGFYYLNDIFNSITKLNYLAIKPYLLILILGNIITLITINTNIKKSYKIANYLLFITNTLIFLINTVIIITNKINLFKITQTENIIKLININFLVFIAYIDLIIIIYILNIIFNKIKLLIKTHPLNFHLNKPFIPKLKLSKKTNPITTSNPDHFKEAKLSKNCFIIDGVDCSVIFEDNNKENILKNYYILLNNVTAKLTNGYTIKEYTKIKNIINKLNIKDLNNINLDLNQLNKITIDEYNLLKEYLNSQGIKI